MKLGKRLFCALLICLALHTLVSEDIRGLVTQEVSIKPEAGFTKQISLLPGEMIILSLEKDAELLTALQLELILSEPLKQYSEFFSIEIYSQIEPAPDFNNMSYTGNNIFFQVMPYLNTVNLKLPYNTTDSKHQTPGNYTLSKGLRFEQFPLLFTIRVISKGIPNSVLLKNFFVKIKAEMVKKGYLNLKISKPNTVAAQDMEIYLDDILTPDIKAMQLLEAGVHALKIVAANCADENTSFTIEIGKTTNLEITLKELISLVFVDILPGTQVFIDGIKQETLPKNGLPVSPGNHTFRFKINDYSISKSIFIAEGKKYNITLFFNIDVKEN